MDILRNKDTWTKGIAEFLGTFLFVFIGLGSIATVISIGQGSIDNGAVIAIALAHGIGITIAIIAIGRISGGHINPAVTIALSVTGNFHWIKGLVYIFFQILGAFTASLIWSKALSTPALGVHNPAWSIPRTLIIEGTLTGLLVFIIFATVVDKRGISKLAPFAIGFMIILGHLVAIPFTGASMNPARSFGPALTTKLFPPPGLPQEALWWSSHWVYWVGPIAGALIAAYIYVIIFGDKNSQDNLSKPGQEE